MEAAPDVDGNDADARRIKPASLGLHARIGLIRTIDGVTLLAVDAVRALCGNSGERRVSSEMHLEPFVFRGQAEIEASFGAAARRGVAGAVVPPMPIRCVTDAA